MGLSSTFVLSVMILTALSRNVSALIGPAVRRTVWRPATTASSRLMLSSQGRDSDKKQGKAKKTNINKFKVVDDITDKHMDKLAAAFDELARNEGFDD